MTLDWPHVIPCSSILFAENWVNFFLDNQWVSWVHLSDHKWPVLINSRYNNLSLSYGSSFIVNGEPWITARQPKCPRHSYFHFNCSLSLFLEIFIIWSIQAILSREDVSFKDFSEPYLEQIHMIKYDVFIFHTFTNRPVMPNSR